MRYLFFLGVALSTVLSLSAQHAHDWCYSDEILAQRMAEDPSLAQEIAQTNAALKQTPAAKTQGTVYKIPVVFHVVYASEADNISVAQIKDGLRVLNEDFRRLNADTNQTRNAFKGDASDVEIEFVLARKDPQGNCTDGITRTKSMRSLTGDNNVKDLINWDNSRYYNIWVTRRVRGTSRGNSGGVILGYSSFPRNGNQNYRDDGTVIRHDEVGTIGTAVTDGRTLTHETGHYLALFHPFQGGCFGGDQVSDTPPVASANYGCDLSTNSCSNDNPDRKDQIENFMDYSSCQNMFTQGQKNRMRNVITNSNLRGGIVSNGNLNFTGVNNPPACPPETKVGMARRYGCTGEPITFSDASEEGSATSWEWQFEKGTPATSTAPNPSVTYQQPGNWDVTLIASNSAGTDTLYLPDYVDVKAKQQPFFDRKWRNSFEYFSQLPFSYTTVDRGDNGTFYVFQGAGSEGNQCLRVDKTPNLPGEVDELISPAIKTKNGQDLFLFFDYAYVAQQNDDDAQLQVLASRDCGENWLLRRTINSGRLRTAANQGGNFVPGNNQWFTEIIPFDAYVQDDPILIKFRFESGGGNHFYLDHIRFGEGRSVGLAESASASSLRAYPNPATETFTVEKPASAGPLHLHISDLQGRLLLEKSFPDTPKPRHEVTHGLPNGLYLIELRSGQQHHSQKLRIQR